MLNDAQVGLFVIEYDSVSLSVSLPVGVKEYAEPAVTVVGGVPVIVGALFGAAVTVIVKAASEAEPPLPSDTLMRTFANEPAAVGVPVSLPVVVLNVAQEGLFVIAQVSVLLSTSVAVGW